MGHWEGLRHPQKADTLATNHENVKLYDKAPSFMALLKWIPRRRLLVWILVLTLLVDALLIAYWVRPPLVTVEADIIIGVRQASSTIAQQQLPVFDPEKSRWMIGNQVVDDFRKSLTYPDRQSLLLDSMGSFFPMRLPDEGGLETLRRAVSQLAKSGICQIAIFDMQIRLDNDAVVMKILRYRDQAGNWKICEDAVNSNPDRID